MTRGGPWAIFTLAGASRWPIALAFIASYSVLRFIGDPLEPGAAAFAYALASIAPAVILAALLAVEAVAARLVGRSVAGAPVLGLIAASALVAQLLVRPSGSVLAEYWVTDPVVAVLTESVFTSMLWILIAAAGISISTFRRQSAELEARADELEAELSAQRDRTLLEDERTVAAISGIVDSTADELATKNLEDVSAALRAWADRVVRPMSHEIAAAGQAAPMPPMPRIGSQWIVAAEKVTARDPLPAVLLGVIALGGTPGLLFRAYPPATAALTWAAVVAFTVGATMGVNYATRPLLPRMRMSWRMALMYVATLPLVVGELVLFRLPLILGLGSAQSQQAMSTLWIGIITSPLLALLTIWIRVLREAGDETLELSQSRARDLALEVARQNMVARQRRAAWAQALHGPVQSAMVAAAIRLDRAQHDGTLDDAAVEQACRPIWEALEAAKSATLDSPPWEAGTARLHALWDGLITLRIDVDPSALTMLDESATCRSAVLEVLTEAVSNAVRHGDAHEVSAQVEGGRDCLAMSIEDDGLPVDINRPQGLGSAVLDDISISWSRQRYDGRNHLAVELPSFADR